MLNDERRIRTLALALAAAALIGSLAAGQSAADLVVEEWLPQVQEEASEPFLGVDGYTPGEDGPGGAHGLDLAGPADGAGSYLDLSGFEPMPLPAVGESRRPDELHGLDDSGSTGDTPSIHLLDGSRDALGLEDLSQNTDSRGDEVIRGDYDNASPSTDTFEGDASGVGIDVDGAKALEQEDPRAELTTSGGTAAIAKSDGGNGGLAWFSEMERVDCTQCHPYRMNVFTVAAWPDGSGSACTGTMIGPRYVLTAGHCLYNHQRGGWARGIAAVPGYSNGYVPYGVAYGSMMMTWEGWTRYAHYSYDMGVVQLDREIGWSVGWLGFCSYSCRTALGIGGHNASYPASPFSNGLTMYYRYGRFDSCPTAGEFRLNNRSYPGQSGSGVYLVREPHRYVYGVISHTGRYAAYTDAIRISPDQFYDIKSFVTN